MNDAHLGAGEINPGQLVRDAYGTDAWLVGFTTHHDIGLDRFFSHLDDAAARAIGVMYWPDTERMSH